MLVGHICTGQMETGQFGTRSISYSDSSAPDYLAQEQVGTGQYCIG